MHMTSQLVGLCKHESQAPIRHAPLSSDNSCSNGHIKARVLFDHMTDHQNFSTILKLLPHSPEKAKKKGAGGMQTM